MKQTRTLDRRARARTSDDQTPLVQAETLTASINGIFLNVLNTFVVHPEWIEVQRTVESGGLRLGRLDRKTEESTLSKHIAAGLWSLVVDNDRCQRKPRGSLSQLCRFLAFLRFDQFCPHQRPNTAPPVATSGLMKLRHMAAADATQSVLLVIDACLRRLDDAHYSLLQLEPRGGFCSAFMISCLILLPSSRPESALEDVPRLDVHFLLRRTSVGVLLSSLRFHITCTSAFRPTHGCLSFDLYALGRRAYQYTSYRVPSPSLPSRDHRNPRTHHELEYGAGAQSACWSLHPISSILLTLLAVAPMSASPRLESIAVLGRFACRQRNSASISRNPEATAPLGPCSSELTIF